MKTDPDKLFYVGYDAGQMLLTTATMSRAVELAHRRLCDYVYSHGHAPPNDAAFLASACKSTRPAWPKLLASLVNHGWRAQRKAFSHPDPLRTVRRARAAYDLAHHNGVLGAKARWKKNHAHSQPKKPLPPQTRTAPEPVPVKLECPPIGAVLPEALPTLPDPKATPTANPCLTLNDKVNLKLNLKKNVKKESLERLTAERSTLSSSAHEAPCSEENQFLKDLVLTLGDFSHKQADLELSNWGGWWRNRFREDPAKARRVLAEIGAMIREKRIHRNAGACAKDLWGRFA